MSLGLKETLERRFVTSVEVSSICNNTWHDLSEITKTSQNKTETRFCMALFLLGNHRSDKRSQNLMHTLSTSCFISLRYLGTSVALMNFLNWDEEHTGYQNESSASWTKLVFTCAEGGWDHFSPFGGKKRLKCEKFGKLLRHIFKRTSPLKIICDLTGEFAQAIKTLYPNLLSMDMRGPGNLFRCKLFSSHERSQNASYTSYTTKNTHFNEIVRKKIK